MIIVGWSQIGGGTSNLDQNEVRTESTSREPRDRNPTTWGADLQWEKGGFQSGGDHRKLWWTLVFRGHFILRSILLVSGESRRGGEDKMLDDLEKSVLKIYEEVNQWFLSVWWSDDDEILLTRLSARTRPASAPSTCWGTSSSGWRPSPRNRRSSIRRRQAWMPLSVREYDKITLNLSPGWDSEGDMWEGEETQRKGG